MRMTDIVSRGALLAVTLGAVVNISCAPPVDLTKNLQVIDVSTGWADAGLTEGGENKLVPFVQFKLKNTSDQNLPVLQVNALFHRVGEKDEWGSGFLTAAGSAGLAPGADTSILTIRSDHGYTGTDPRNLRLTHSQPSRININRL